MRLGLAGQQPQTDGLGNKEYIAILAGKLFDPYTLELLSNQLITVSETTGQIHQVRTFIEEEIALLHLEDGHIIDLRHLTVLPGFVDAHVHFFLHPYSETSWDDQLTKESIAERTIRATVHAKRTLMAGFTTVRDLGTEGAGDADLALRKSMSGPMPLIPGPRYFTANRAIVPTGAYGPKSSILPSQEGVNGVTGAEVADGPEECMKAVRRQVGAGADWIKIYGDYRFRSRTLDVLPLVARSSIPTFNSIEIKAILEAALQYGVKVAAHSSVPRVMKELLSYGVHSIEHGTGLGTDDSARQLLRDWVKKETTFWVPTLSAVYTMRNLDGGVYWERAATAFKLALEVGMEHFACGGDTGVFAHGDNALEMQLMVRLGASWRKVLRWGTLNGWRCIRPLDWEAKEGEERLRRIEETGGIGQDAYTVGDNDVPFGAIRRGWAADIIAVAGDLENDFENAVSVQAIKFVMKGGKIFKQNGLEVSGL